MLIYPFVKHAWEDATLCRLAILMDTGKEPHWPSWPISKAESDCRTCCMAGGQDRSGASAKLKGLLLSRGNLSEPSKKIHGEMSGF